jgi:putative transposase
MANTYTQIHIHVIFAVKFRAGLIKNEWKNDLYKYITGIAQNNQHKILAINGMPDHIHILIGMRPNQSLSDLIQDIKGSSSKWINTQNFVKGKFEWQQGFGAFACSKSHVPKVISYIENQESHHSSASLVDEYKQVLEKSGIDYDEQYIFKSAE